MREESSDVAVGRRVRAPWSNELRRVARLARRQPLGVSSALVLVLVFVVAAAAPLLANHDPVGVDVRNKLASPSTVHYLGTDHLGRDTFSRIVYGARISLLVGFSAVFLAQTLSLMVGVSSAYFGGKIDLIAQRIVDALMVFPTLILALVIAAVLGSSIPNVILAIALAQWPRSSRILRSAALSVRSMAYIEAARAIGCSDQRIIFRHMIPNTMAPFLILVTASLGGAIIVEASLSFLALGVPEPHPSWGRMLSGASGYAEVAPWLVLAPGLAITLVVLAFNLLGDSMRDILDPRLRVG